MVAGKQSLAFAKTEMAAKMSRRMDHPQPPVRPGDHFAIADAAVGGKGEVKPVAGPRKVNDALSPLPRPLLDED